MLNHKEKILLFLLKNENSNLFIISNCIEGKRDTIKKILSSMKSKGYIKGVLLFGEKFFRYRVTDYGISYLKCNDLIK